MNIWSRLFVPASPLVVAEPKKSRDKKNHNWNATPERLLLKCILGHLVRSGLARKDLLVKFKRLIPDYDMFFDSPVSDSAIWGRADTGRRQGKSFFAPKFETYCLLAAITSSTILDMRHPSVRLCANEKCLSGRFER